LQDSFFYVHFVVGVYILPTKKLEKCIIKRLIEQQPNGPNHTWIYRERTNGSRAPGSPFFEFFFFQKWHLKVSKNWDKKS
jgi:hypothetical protein